nr:Ycf60 [Porphyropsis coccinea]
MPKIKIRHTKLVKQSTLKTYFVSSILITITLAIILALCKEQFPEYELIKKPKPNLDGKKITISTRLICMIPYFLPLLECCEHFAARVILSYPNRFIKIYRKTLWPVVVFYIENRFVNFISFLIFYFLLVSSKSPLPINEFLRYNTLQALLIFLVGTMLGVAFKTLPREIKRSRYGGSTCNMLFIFVICLIFYAAFEAMRGKYAELPVISEAVRIQINSKGI